jgi:hypothetical protein
MQSCGCSGCTLYVTPLPTLATSAPERRQSRRFIRCGNATLPLCRFASDRSALLICACMLIRPSSAIAFIALPRHSTELAADRVQRRIARGWLADCPDGRRGRSSAAGWPAEAVVLPRERADYGLLIQPWRDRGHANSACLSHPTRADCLAYPGQYLRNGIGGSFRT